MTSLMKIWSVWDLVVRTVSGPRLVILMVHLGEEKTVYLTRTEENIQFQSNLK